MQKLYNLYFRTLFRASIYLFYFKTKFLTKRIRKELDNANRIKEEEGIQEACLFLRRYMDDILKWEEKVILAQVKVFLNVENS